MAQEFNSDPQGWELTDKFGDRSLRIWIEVLAIIDREKNQWKRVDGWDSVIARKVRQSPATVRSVVGWMLANGWLEVGQLSASGQPEFLRARNYPKYHKTRSEVRPPPNLTYPNLSEPKDPLPAAPAPSVDSKSQKTGLDPEVKKWADLIYRGNPKRYARLITWIKAALRNYSPAVVATTLERFSPHASDENLGNWWPYLDKILDKQEGLKNARNNEIESARIKREEKDFFIV